MGNKVKYNLKNVHAAKLTETVTDGVKSFSYGTPKAIPGAVSIGMWKRSAKTLISSRKSTRSSAI